MGCINASYSFRIRKSKLTQDPPGTFHGPPTDAIAIVNKLFYEVDKAQSQSVGEWTKDLDTPEMKDTLKDQIDIMVNARMAARLAQKKASSSSSSSLPSNSSSSSSTSTSSASSEEKPWPKLTPNGIEEVAPVLKQTSNNTNNNSADVFSRTLSTREQIQEAIKSAISAAKAKAAAAPPSGKRLEKPVMLPQGADFMYGSGSGSEVQAMSSSISSTSSSSENNNKVNEPDKSSSLNDSPVNGAIPLRMAYEPQATFSNNRDDDLQSCQVQDINDPTETTVERAQSRIDQLKKKLKCMRNRGEDVEDEIGTLRKKIEREQTSNTEQIDKEKQALEKDRQTYQANEKK